MSKLQKRPMRWAIHHLLEPKWKDGNVITGLKRKKVRFLYPARSAEEITKIFRHELKDYGSTRVAGKRYAVYLDIQKKRDKPEVLPSGTWYDYEIELKAKEE